MKSIAKSNLLEMFFVFLTVGCFFRFVVVAALHLVVFLVAFIFFIIVCCINFNLKISIIDFMFLCLYLAIGVLLWFFSNNPSDNSLVYYLLMFSLPILYFFIAKCYLNNLTYMMILRILKKIMRLLIVYLFCELGFRIYSIFSALLARDFVYLYYMIKRITFTYTDCNFLGLFVLFILCLNLYLFEYTGDKFFKRYSKFLIFFGFASMSRSVMLTIIAIFYIRFFFTKYRKGHFVFVIGNLLLIPFAIIVLYVFLLNDSSFRSKVGIFMGLKQIADMPLINVLCGFGYGIGEYTYSYVKNGYGHAHINILLGNIGIIGSILFIINFFRINFMAKNKTGYVVFAFLLTGFSLMYLDSSLFFVMAIISTLEEKKKLSVNNEIKNIDKYSNSYVKQTS